MSSNRFQELEAGRGMNRADLDRLSAVVASEEAKWKRARSAGIIGTVVLHLLLLLWFRGVTVPPMSPSAAAGPAMGDIRPSAGGSGLTMVEVRAERPPVVEEIPDPVPIPEEVIIPEEIEIPPPAAEPAAPSVTPSQPGSTAPGQGGDSDTDAAPGPGAGAGDGAGGGGDSDGGASRVIPPTPRGVFIPPAGRPTSARGQEITVWVFVTEAGRVERNSVRLEPPTSDSRYNQRLMQSVAEWVFDPARQDGRAVSVWYPFQVIL